MDIFPMLFDIQLIIFAAVLVIWALHKPAGRRVRRRKPVIMEVRPVPRMTAEEIVKVVDSL